MDVSIVFAYFATMCPPMIAHCRQMANTIKLVLPSAYPSPQPERQIDQFSHFCTGHGRLSSGRLAPAVEYDCTCASFGPHESATKTANRSVQPFLHSSGKNVPILYNGRPYPPELPLPMGDLDPHVTHHALGPCEPTTQRAPRSVEPFLHRWPQSVPILYNGLPVSPSILPIPMGIWTPCNTWFLGLTGVLNPNGISIASAVFPGLTSVIDWQTDRQTALLGR